MKKKKTHIVLRIWFEFPRRPGLISPLQNISHLLILLHKWLFASYSMLSPLMLFFGCVFFSCGPKWRETQLIRVSKQKMAERIVSLHVEEVRKNAVHRHLSLNRIYSFDNHVHIGCIFLSQHAARFTENFISPFIYKMNEKTDFLIYLKNWHF